MVETPTPSRVRSVDLQAALHADPRGVPFQVELSLRPLADFWGRSLGHEGSVKSAVARMIQEAVAKAPELLEPITDLAVIERHKDLVDLLMATVFPPAFFEREFGAALVPFQLRAFYATAPFRKLLMAPDGALTGRVNLDPAMVSNLRLLYFYALVLERLYGLRVDVDYPLIFTVPDPDTGLDRHFKMEFDWRFVQVDAPAGKPVLSDEACARLTQGLLEPEVLLGVLPPAHFRLRGVTIFRAVEVTDQEVLSSIERDLIDKESIVSSERFRELQDRLRTFFRRPALKLGLAALEGDKVLILHYGSQLEHACIFADSVHHTTAEFAGSIFERAVQQGQPLLVHDLATLPGRTRVEDQMLDNAVRAVVVAPLRYQDRVIGTLELTSPRPGDFDATLLPKLHEVLPLFSMAVQRSMEELNARVQGVIKEKATAIHPVVEWRFRRAVLDTIERSGGTPGLELEPIVFEQVYPLYALADIRGSSTHRALAIQGDLTTQLQLARDVVDAAARARHLPALDELRYRLDRHLAEIGHGLSSGAEVTVIAFLRAEVERLLDHVATFGPEVRERAAAYRGRLDPRLGAVYQRRQQFEESVTRIAATISAYLDLEEQAAQAIYPHYFEKQKTDGVDYQIYAGAALLEDGHFDPLYLKSLRLWQLMVSCGIALRVHQLRDELPVPLETTHLILVQHAPLSIRFRFDEKRFDVDGAYDIRYEIVKKRIDKATVRGTGERVTQPGQLAIVYAQPSEAAEYRAYLEYLQSLGYLTGGVEELELEELQGVHGLRALRVAVDLRRPRHPGAAARLAQVGAGPVRA